jgi:hypothetical protein
VITGGKGRGFGGVFKKKSRSKKDVPIHQKETLVRAKDARWAKEAIRANDARRAKEALGACILSLVGRGYLQICWAGTFA